MIYAFTDFASKCWEVGKGRRCGGAGKKVGRGREEGGEGQERLEVARCIWMGKQNFWSNKTFLI